MTVWVLVGGSDRLPPPPPATCEDLQLRTCSDAAYNRTAFPTALEHRSREAVESSSEYILLSVLHHLLEGQCNPDLRLLGCAVVAPRCEGGRVHRPCQHVCEALREACQPAFDAIDMAWPYFLDCGRYFGSEEEGCYDPLEKLRGKWGLWGAVVWSSQVTQRSRKVPPPGRRRGDRMQAPSWDCRQRKSMTAPGAGALAAAPSRKLLCMAAVHGLCLRLL